MREARPWGMVAEFATADAAIAAARRLRLNGFRRMDAYTPFPVPGLEEALRPGRHPWIPILIFLGAAIGAGYSFFLQYWAAVLSYPINVGGRPYDSWPAFIVSSFEVTVLFAVATAFFVFLISCGLPLLYHPVFTAPDFDRASQDRFFLCVEGRDRRFDVERLKDLFARQQALRVSVVAR